MNKYESIDGIGEYIPGVTNRAVLNSPIYVVHAQRWGDCEKHSYIVVATTQEIDALAAAEMTELERGGKYGCEISCFNCGEKTIIRKPYDGKDYYTNRAEMAVKL